MAMTKREFIAKDEIMKVLARNGYPTYAKLLSDFEIHLTKDPKVIGYMLPAKGSITVNEGLDIEQVGVVVRHEILHEFFNHTQRFSDYLGADAYNKRSNSQHKLMNIAGDYDISNRGYTEEDKKNIRKIKLGDKLLSGLVTEDKHPDWLNLSATEMYAKLQELRKQEKANMEKEIEKRFAGHDQNYVDIYNKIITKYKKASAEELADVIKRFKNGENIL